MRLIALFSGGKDSLYAAVYAECVLGHKVVAGVNLYPAGPVGVSSKPSSSSSTEFIGEVDSAMLQSVGAHIVGAAYSHCLPGTVQMYRRAFQRLEFTTDNSLHYGPLEQIKRAREDADEVSALDQVIGEILADFGARGLARPDGLVSGAILSDYQRLRVEYVAMRHQLVSLAPLWHRKSTELFDSILSLGINAVLVKVASLGLDKTHLGQPLHLVRDHLQRLEDRYGVHCLGEGGEYESLVLDSPWFRQRLVLDTCTAVDHGAGSAYLHVERFHWEPKPESIRSAERTHLEHWASVERARLHWVFPVQVVAAVNQSALVSAPKPSEWNRRTRPSHVVRCMEKFWSLPNAQGFYFCNIWAEVPNHAPESIANSCLREDALEEAALQMEQLVEYVHENWPTDDCLPFLCVLYLANMSHFQKVNAVYARLFSREHAPPARCCIQLSSLPHRTSLVQLEIFAESNTLHGRAIHVQSLSLWAPACIGPYSQGRIQNAGTTLYLSGVIALFPATGEIPPGLDLDAQIQACIWNAQRIVDAFKILEQEPEWCCYFCIAWYEAPNRTSGETRGLLIHEKLRQSLPEANLFVLGVPQLPRRALVELQLVYERRTPRVDTSTIPGTPQIVHEFIDIETECLEPDAGTATSSFEAAAKVQIPVFVPRSVYGASCTRLRCQLPGHRSVASLSAL